MSHPNIKPNFCNNRAISTTDLTLICEKCNYITVKGDESNHYQQTNSAKPDAKYSGV